MTPPWEQQLERESVSQLPEHIKNKIRDVAKFARRRAEL
jgi:hypothetical protein